MKTPKLGSGSTGGRVLHKLDVSGSGLGAAPHGGRRHDPGVVASCRGRQWWPREGTVSNLRPLAAGGPRLCDAENDFKFPDLRFGPGPSLHEAVCGPRTAWLVAPPPGLGVCPSRRGLAGDGHPEGPVGGPQDPREATGRWDAACPCVVALPAGCHVESGGGQGPHGPARMLRAAARLPGPMALTRT